MKSKDKNQTYNQFRIRKRRIKCAEKYENQIQKRNNEILDIDQEIEKLNLLKKKKIEEVNKINEDKFYELLSVYNDINIVRETIKLGRETTFSETLINDIDEKCKKGINEDNMEYADIDILVNIERKINKDIPHTNILSDALNSFGDCIELHKKEDSSYGN